MWVDANQQLQLRQYDAAGPLAGSAAVLDTGSFTQVTGVQALARSDGGFVLAWSGRETTTGVQAAFLRRFNAAGAGEGSAIAVSSLAGEKSDLRISVRPDGTLLAAWVQGNADGSAFRVLARPFDAALNPLDPVLVVGAEAPGDTRPIELSVSSDASGSTLVAWAVQSLGEVRWQVLSGGGGLIGAAGATSFPRNALIDTVEAVQGSGSFRVVVESTVGFSRGTNGFGTVLTVDAAGTLAARDELGQRALFTVSATTGATCGNAAAGIAATGGADGRYLLAYEACAAQGTAAVNLLAR